MKKLFFLGFAILFVGLLSCQQDAPAPSNTQEPSKVIIQVEPPSSGTVVIVDKYGNIYDTGIENKTLEDGETINQKIERCKETARNHGDFVSCMAHLTNYLLKNGYITNKEKGVIMRMAAQADIP
jgi:hemolysin activation/secretion protein